MAAQDANIERPDVSEQVSMAIPSIPVARISSRVP
jgi:hypothetical protein